MLEIFFDFLLSKLFYKEKVHKFQQIYGKMWMKKMFIEGNQIHNFMSKSYGSYGSGSGSTTLVVFDKTAFVKFWISNNQ